MANMVTTVTTEDRAWTQLATRIPKRVHHELKVHCIQSDVSIMEFVVQAVGEKLRRASAGRPKRKPTRA